MKVPYADIFEVVRARTDAKTAFKALRSVASREMSWRPWGKIQFPGLFEADVLEAARWMADSLSGYPATGVHLALGPDSQREGFGTNVCISMTTKADPETESTDWVCDQHGEDHLIYGLFELHRSYKKFDLAHPASLLADYIFYLGYGGMVLTAALERLSMRRVCIIAWSFPYEHFQHPLARVRPTGVERLAKSNEKK